MSTASHPLGILQLTSMRLGVILATGAILRSCMVRARARADLRVAPLIISEPAKESESWSSTSVLQKIDELDRQWFKTKTKCTELKPQLQKWIRPSSNRAREDFTAAAKYLQVILAQVDLFSFFTQVDQDHLL